MKKYLQNVIAESGATLPVLMVYTLVVWLLAGLIVQGWWGQLALLGVSVYLLIELSNGNALMRMRSRMVSCTFLVLSSISIAWFHSFSCGLLTLCLIGTLLLLFHSYRSPTASGATYYAFLLLGIASMGFMQLLYFIPLFWVLMAFELQMLSWLTWRSSVLGLLTPYWLCVPWFVLRQENELMMSRLSNLFHLENTFDLSQLNVGQMVVLLFIVGLIIMGIAHFWRYNYQEKIRNRQLYGFFFYLSLASLFFLLMQPQHFDPLLRIIVVCASPLTAHFFIHTRTKVTNALFFCIVTFSVLLTLDQLFPHLFSLGLWSGL